MRWESSLLVGWSIGPSQLTFTNGYTPDSPACLRRRQKMHLASLMLRWIWWKDDVASSEYFDARHWSILPINDVPLEAIVSGFEMCALPKGTRQRFNETLLLTAEKLSWTWAILGWVRILGVKSGSFPQDHKRPNCLPFTSFILRLHAGNFRESKDTELRLL